MIEDIMNEIISERKKKHIEDDYGIQRCWNQMIKILSKDIIRILWVNFYYLFRNSYMSV